MQNKLLKGYISYLNKALRLFLWGMILGTSMGCIGSLSTLNPFSPPAATKTRQTAQVTQSFWPDRRPIGMLMLAPVGGAGANKEGYAPNNPRGWFSDHSIDIRTPQGIASFQNRLLTWADGDIVLLKKINAQGAISWDLEGEEYPQDATYIGDPSLLSKLAPEMESVIQDSGSPYNGMHLVDAYFKKLKDAGFTLGLTLRPQTLEFNNSTDCNFAEDLFHTCQPFSVDENFAIQILMKKVAYAKQRWGIKIFYVDSNVVADQYWKCAPWDSSQDPAACQHPMILSNGKSRLGSIPLNASVFNAVLRANPDILFIPEHNFGANPDNHPEQLDYFATTAPLYQLFQDYGQIGQSNYAPAHTPDLERQLHPGAFSAIIMNNTSMVQGDQRYNELVQGVSQGDLLITRSWWDEADLNLVNSIYRDAGAFTSPPPSPAPAPIPPSTDYNGSLSTELPGTRCLDIMSWGHSADTLVQSWDCNGYQNQSFHMISATGQMKVYNDSMCVGIGDDKISNGAHIVLANCSGKPDQKWSYNSANRAIVNANGKCMDVASYNPNNGAKIQIWDCFGGANQAWDIH